MKLKEKGEELRAKLKDLRIIDVWKRRFNL